jgi:hypothetical protein
MASGSRANCENKGKASANDILTSVLAGKLAGENMGDLDFCVKL